MTPGHWPRWGVLLPRLSDVTTVETCLVTQLVPRSWFTLATYKEEEEKDEEWEKEKEEEDKEDEKEDNNDDITLHCELHWQLVFSVHQHFIDHLSLLFCVTFYCSMTIKGLAGAGR